MIKVLDLVEKAVKRLAEENIIVVESKPRSNTKAALAMAAVGAAAAGSGVAGVAALALGPIGLIGASVLGSMNSLIKIDVPQLIIKVVDINALWE